MSLPLYSSTVGGGGGGAPRVPLPPTTTSALPIRPQFHSLTPSLCSARTSHVVGATNKSTPRTGKFDSKNRRNSSSASTATSKEQDKPPGRRATLEKREKEADEAEVMETFADDGFVMPDLPGKDTDFWEGSKWDGLGFFVQYMWAFGIVFAVVACGIAVTTYNEGASDFKDTPVYKESVQSRDLLEGPEASNSDVFESNPTEEAPSLE